jgi:hypothetical protein
MSDHAETAPSSHPVLDQVVARYFYEQEVRHFWDEPGLTVRTRALDGGWYETRVTTGLIEEPGQAAFRRDETAR